MKIKQLVALSLIGLAIGACKRPGSDGPDSPDPDEGKTGRLKLSFALPGNIKTYAAGDADPTATAAERDVNYIDIFVYADGGSFELDHFRVNNSGGALINDTDNIWEIADELRVRPGVKQVYVGINLPAHIVERLEKGHYINEDFSTNGIALDALEEDGAGASLGNDGSLAFFNATTDVGGAGTHIVTVSATVPTTFSVDVERLVAKIVVRTSLAFQTALPTHIVSGGKLSDLQFTIGQRNQLTYVTPLVGLKDPNFAVGSAAGQLDLVDPTVNPYRAVTPYNAGTMGTNTWLALPGTQKVYAPANTIDWGAGGPGDPTTATHEDVTYVSVQAVFTPELLDDTGDPGDPGDDFYAVFTGNDIDEGMGQRYFSTQVAARAYVRSPEFLGIMGLAGTNVDTDPEADSYIHFYEDGLCYYRLYLNYANNYNVLRNNIYIATITDINYIGTIAPNILPGSENTPTNPRGVTPAVPEVQQDDLIIYNPRVETLLGEILLVPWVPSDANYELQ